jgi:vitamin B12 transporter
MLVLPLFRLVAQPVKDSTLREIKIRGSHKASNDTRVNDFAPGQKVISIDTLTLQQYQMQSMASMLSQQTASFVKLYGFNGLATLNFRGASAAQSAVYWNGVPIQNAALGIADISTLPVLFMNKVSVLQGSAAGLWGSGNVGGALLLENDVPVFDSQSRALSLSGGAGSFNQYSTALKGMLSGKRWFFSANILTQVAQNDFSYEKGENELTLSNSRLRSEAIMARVAYKINTPNTLSLSAWQQQYFREIPPALFERYSTKKQTDGSVRLLGEWRRNTTKTSWYARSSFIKDEIHYTDDAVLLRSDNTVYQYFQDIGLRRRFGNYGQLLIFSPVQVAWINTPAGAQQQTKVALVAAYEKEFFANRLNIAISSRDEQIIQSGGLSPRKNVFLPGASASFAITSWLATRVNVQRTYRLPTLNELYYNPGGNAGLKPEQGWSEEAGYNARFIKGSGTLSHNLTAFNRNIQDWIIWLGGAIWTPHNIATVHSRGIETENKLTYTLNKWQFHVGINTAYILATTVSSYVPLDGSIGKQIPYSPRYNGNLNAGFTFRQLYFNFNQTYTGYRFITTDESDYLLPYYTSNVQLMYNTAFSRHDLQLTFQCNNVFNQRYYVVRDRPMPGINWLVGFKLGII